MDREDDGNDHKWVCDKENDGGDRQAEKMLKTMDVECEPRRQRRP